MREKADRPRLSLLQVKAARAFGSLSTFIYFSIRGSQVILMHMSRE
ncbi:MAG: hypothetical protein HEP71_32705 [Roseivirga sp.]|nr:hypothetical protein [Roseivirga sp.]